jgi:hypothetical protein
MTAKPIASSSVLDRFSASEMEIAAPSLDEINALRAIDDVLRPEEIGDLRRLGAAEQLAIGLDGRGSSDDLRLPPPRSGQSLGRALSTVLRTFESKKSPIAATPEALQAEARLMAIVAGLLRLQSEIQEKSAMRPETGAR